MPAGRTHAAAEWPCLPTLSEAPQAAARRQPEAVGTDAADAWRSPAADQPVEAKELADEAGPRRSRHGSVREEQVAKRQRMAEALQARDGARRRSR